jgi:hypothetical protein
MVSTQPELPLRCCTSQASVIRIDIDTAMPANASKAKTVMRNPGNQR